MEKRITITIDIDIPQDYELPEWLIGKTNEEIEDFCNDQVDNFIRDKLECDFQNGITDNYTQIEEWED